MLHYKQTSDLETVFYKIGEVRNNIRNIANWVKIEAKMFWI